MTIDVKEAAELMAAFATRPNFSAGPHAVEAVATAYLDLRRRLDTLGEDLTEILGMPNFRAGPIAHLFKAAGEAKVPARSEDEQAFVLHWLLGLFLQHGEKWRPVAGEQIRAMTEKVRAAKAGFARTEG